MYFKSIITVCCFLYASLLAAQPDPIAVFCTFRLFDPAGKALINKQDSFAFYSLPGTTHRWGELKARDDDSYSCEAKWRHPVELVFAYQGDTMRISTTAGLDSVPFLPGEFRIDNSTAFLLNARYAPGLTIEGGTWERVRVDESKETPFFPDLPSQESQYTMDEAVNTDSWGRPRLDGFRYQPKQSSKCYAWTAYDLFVSADKGVHWELLKTFSRPNGLRCIRDVTLKGKDTLLVSPYNVFNEHDPILQSTDGGRTWEEVESLNAHHFESVHFKDSKEGFAVRYQRDSLSKEWKEHTHYFRTWNGGKSWKQVYEYPQSLYHNRIKSWVGDTIRMAYRQSRNGGVSWREYAPNESASWTADMLKQAQGEHPLVLPWQEYPRQAYLSVGGLNNNTLYTVMRSGENMLLEKQIEVEAYHVDLAKDNQSWVLAGQDFTYITTDAGQSWRYYPQRVKNSNVLEVIDDTYLFTGDRCYRLR